MTFWQSLFLGFLQGATELFPVSSLGHAVLGPSLLHWSFRQSDPSFVPFLVLLHLGTATALLVLYREQWIAIIRGFFTAALRGQMKTDSERLAMLLLVGTIPAAILGVFLENRIKTLFASPYEAAVFLIVNGLLMLGFEFLRRRRERGASRAEQESHFAQAERISFIAAALVGACQALAFLLATPVILGAGLVEVPELLKPGVPIGEYVAAAVLAGVAAYASARFLLRYFRSGRLDPYGAYCIAAGLLSLALLHFGL